MLKSWVLFILALLFFSLPSMSLGSFSYELPDITVAGRDHGFMIPGNARSLKKTGPEENPGTAETTNNGEEFSLEDYRPVDPSPTTKASIKSGPIQHGSPLNPYIPKPPSSPGDPNDGG